MPTQTTTAPAGTDKLRDIVTAVNDSVGSSIKKWGSFARNVPSTLTNPADLVNRYFGLAEKRIARQRQIAQKLVDALPKRSA